MPKGTLSTGAWQIIQKLSEKKISTRRLGFKANVLLLKKVEFIFFIWYYS